jgi:hypothetical protein
MPTEIDELAGRLEIGDVVGFCPVQCEGTIDGLPFYFRARGSAWQFCVAATPAGDPLDVMLAAMKGEGAGEGFYRCGGWYQFTSAEWLVRHEVNRIVRDCAAEFVRERR